jgi:hypothetical protein
MAAVKLGINAKLFYNAGTYGTPSWTEVTQISDLTENIKSQKAECNDRSSPVNKSVITSQDVSWSGKIKNDESTAFNYFYEAIFEKTTTDVLVLNGGSTTNGVRGFRADVQIHDMSNDQGRNASIYHDLMFEPTDSSNPVKAVLVTGGALTYATITGTTLSFA